MQARGGRPGTRPAAAPGVQLRAVRAALFTVLCTTLSATSHVLLSRVPLPPAPVAAVCAGVFAAAWLHRGDAALDAVLRAAAAGGFRSLRTAAAERTAAPAPPRRRIRPLHPLPPARPLPLLVHCVRRRGPPRPASA
ncbi:hypothetical protein AB0G60_32250 [Streptomyces angustmyceticus]|uniref:Uncharacterized protein n=1 Tax=Streptomyces angustmyceticus TaxID=285578 RepID=A0A5J4LQZ6_9ACTN|nr:hypothetical protein [Streptomyces angustmyceticus]UAL69675.1 hypothetical protein K7396_26610 [Streptomyces angustmyceticus]GES34422.1 hypothetical protein San01_69100 [Streptomyces angustmyceticus]